MRGGDQTISARWQCALPWLVFCTALGVYVWSLCPTLYWGDGAGWIAASVTVGVPSSSGCPFYLMVGRLFSHLPWGDLPFRFNLLSAVCGATSVALVYGIALRTSVRGLGMAARRAVGLAVVAAAMALLSGEVWLLSATAELYMPVAALVLAAWLCADLAADTRDVRFLLASALLLGLGLSVHPSALFALPALVACLWPARRELLSPKPLAGSAALTVCGVVLYAYLPVVAAKDPAINWGDPDTPLRFWRAVSGADFAYLKAWPTAADVGWKAVEVAYLTRDSVSLVVLALGAVGLLAAVRRLVPLALLGAGNVAMVCVYGTAETASYLALPQLVGAAFAALGLGWLADQVGERIRGVRAVTPATVATIIGVAAVLGNAVHNVYTSPKRTETTGRLFPEALLTALPRDSVLLCDHSGVHLAVDYLQWVEGQRQDVLNVYTPLLGLDWVRRGLAKRDATLAVDAPVPESVVALVQQLGNRRCVFHMADALGPLSEVRNRPLGPLFLVSAESDPPAACLGSTAGLKEWESVLVPSTDEGVHELRANVHLNLARHALSTGDLRGAIAACTMAVQAAPNEAAPWASLGSLLVAGGQKEKGEDALRRAKELAPWETRGVLLPAP